MSVPDYPVALIVEGLLAEAASRGGGCAYLYLPKDSGRLNMTPGDLLRQIADEVDAGRVFVSAIEFGPVG